MNTMLSWTAGSTLHGLRDEQSDVDTRIVAYESADSILTQRYHQTTHDAEHDITIMMMRDYINLLLRGAPNMIEGLLADGECLLEHDDIADNLRAHTSSFITRGTISSLIGMAGSNIKLLATHGDLDDRKHGKIQSNIIFELRCARHVADEHILPTRIDTDELLAIKHGRYIHDMQSWMQLLDREMRSAKYAEEHTDIMQSPDKETCQYCEDLIVEANSITLSRQKAQKLTIC